MDSQMTRTILQLASVGSRVVTTSLCRSRSSAQPGRCQRSVQVRPRWGLHNPLGKRCITGSRHRSAHPRPRHAHAHKPDAAPQDEQPQQQLQQQNQRQQPQQLLTLPERHHDVLALDVEYVHLAPMRSRGCVTVVPAEVCLVSPGGVVAMHEYCHPGTEAMEGRRVAGGVPERLWRDALPLPDAARRVELLIQGHTLVGHSLGKDLTALGVHHPRDLQVDTMCWKGFQGPGGQARPLRVLALQLLGRAIQTGRHSAREDAEAALELYLRYMAGNTAAMDATALQAHHLADMLRHAAEQEASVGEGG